MAWTDIARAEHNRDRLRFPSDLTDREWAIVEPMIPGARRGGRPRTTDMRDVMEPVFGQMKGTQGADGFMMRGEEEARGEWSLHCARHNFRKLHSESIRQGKKGGKWLIN